MGRDVKRVPLDFEWPLNKVWSGFLMPDSLREDPCPMCGRTGYDGRAEHGDGLTVNARAVSETFYPHMLGSMDRERSEALAWHNKLGQAEVDMLIEEGRIGRRLLFDRIELDPPYEISEYGNEIKFRWDRNDTPAPTAAEVNAANSRGGSGLMGDFGHDAISRMMLVRHRCDVLGIDRVCQTCDGHGCVENYPGQRDEADAWEPTDPPTGDGWQLWETVSEGSPISPVFATAEGLAQWLTTPASCWGAMNTPMTIESARGFVGVGWSPSLIANSGGVHDGAEYVGTKEALRDHDL